MFQHKRIVDLNRRSRIENKKINLNRDLIEMINMVKDEDEIDEYQHIHLYMTKILIDDKLNDLLLNLSEDMKVE